MLQIAHLHRHIGNNQIVNDVNFTMHSWQAVGLVGPNGCGKTSLLNLINGFNIPQSGSIIFDGKHITKLSVEQRALQGIGRVFQNFGIFKNLTLEENLALAFVHKLPWRGKRLPISSLPREMKEKIIDILEQLDLHDKKNHLAWSLSGGQMRLLELARLYLQDTKLYLLDEPTAWVSPKLKGKVTALIQKIRIAWKTILIVEHDFAFLSQFVDEVCVMNEGTIIIRDTPQNIPHNPKVREVYFGK